MIPRSVRFLAVTLGVTSSLTAQDTRTVVEPFFPQLCATLDAQLRTNAAPWRQPTSKSLTRRVFRKLSTSAARGVP
jgi:hypothetical protein